jgi:hypothetical protein
MLLLLRVVAVLLLLRLSVVGLGIFHLQFAVCIMISLFCESTKICHCAAIADVTRSVDRSSRNGLLDGGAYYEVNYSLLCIMFVAK